MTHTLKELLTLELADDGKPLFPTAASLGKAIVTQKATEYTNARSANTLIGFIFCGKRSCPKSLREMILKATRERLAKEPQDSQNDWEQRIIQAIDFLNINIAKANKERPEPAKNQFERFLKRSELAKKHFIITHSPTALEQDVLYAEELIKRLFCVLGIYPKSTTLPTTQYCYLLPHQKTGSSFWNELRKKALLQFEEVEEHHWVEERFQFLEENGCLQLYIVPPFVCGCHMVVHDPDSTRNFSGFSFSHHPNDAIDIISWDNLTVLKWKENVYERFYWKDPNTQKPFETETAAMEFMKNHPGTFAGYRCPIPSH